MSSVTIEDIIEDTKARMMTSVSEEEMMEHFDSGYRQMFEAIVTKRRRVEQ
mgnify:FL=1